MNGSQVKRGARAGGALLLALGLLGTAGLPATVPSATAATTTAAPTRATQASQAIVLSATDNASSPSVGVEADGTGHITWVERDADDVDSLHYCRLPRGASACERSETFLVPGGLTSFGPADVVLPGDGRVQVVGSFCCGGAEGTYLVESLDGGDSFLPARRIGTAGTGYSIAGPGDNAITMIEDAPSAIVGARVQVAETDGGITSATAGVGDPDLSQYYAGGVGLIDAATPIAAYTDLTDTTIRRYDAGAGTDYNDIGNWSDPLTIPGEDEPTLVTGAAGTFVMTHVEYDDSALRDAYQVRRISPDDQDESPLGDPFVASDISRSLFGTLTADDEGGLTAVWTDEGDAAAIRSSYAVNGTSFTAPGTVVQGARGFHLKVDTAGDGGGFVVWDENFEGRVLVAAIPAGGVVPDTDPPVEPPKHVGGFTPGNNTSACTRKVTIKAGVVAAVRSGCFDEDGPHGYTTKSDVNVNGIDFVTGSKSTKVTIDTKTHTISAGAGVVQKAGPVILAKDAGTWDVDGTTTFQGLEKAKIKLFDFPVLGEAGVKFASGKAEVTVNLGMPKPFDAVSGQSVLTTTQAKGLILTGIRIEAKNLTIGPFGVQDLSVTYDAGVSAFSGTARLKLPPAGTYVGIDIGFKAGQLVRLHLEARDGPPFPFTIYPGLWVTGLGFGYDGTNGFAIGGGADVGIPTPAGPIRVEAIGSPPGTGGGFRFALPHTGGAEMTLGGDLRVLGIKLGSATSHFRTSGEFDFGAALDLGAPRLGIHGGVKGDVDLEAGTFHANIAVELCVVICLLEAQGVLSDIGVAVCGELDFGLFEVGLMFGYRWASGPDVGTSCATGLFTTPGSGGPSPTGVTVGPDGTLYVPGTSDDVTTYTVNVPGTTGVPHVVVRDQGGAVIVQSDAADPLEPQSGDRVVLVPSPTTDSVRVVIVQDSSTPKQFRITTSADSPKLALRTTRLGPDQQQVTPAFTVAETLPETRVSGTLSGSGRSRTLAYSVSDLDEAGRSVRFVETGRGVSHVLGTTTRATGRLPFTVAQGRAGRRTVQAIVLNADGLPVASSTVAAFQAPGYVLPVKPKRLTLGVSKKDKLTATWKGKGARSYLVRVAVADGRRLLLLPARSKVVVPKVSRKEKVVVTVTGVDARGRTGRTATAKR